MDSLVASAFRRKINPGANFRLPKPRQWSRAYFLGAGVDSVLSASAVQA
jgi:hypothetical protein